MASYVGEGPIFLLEYALRGLRVAVLLSLWQVILSDQPDAPMTLAAVLTYTLMSEVFGSQLLVRTQIATAFWEGSIVTHFVQPMGIVSQFAAGLLGRWVIDWAFFSLPLLAVASWLGVPVFPATAEAGLLFLCSLSLSVCLGLALDFIFAALAIALELPTWLIESMRRALTRLLAGAVIPLALLPWGLGEIFQWLPFASLAWAPLAIYTATADAGGLLAGQVAWSLTLWPLALWMWRANREKMVAHGG